MESDRFELSRFVASQDPIFEESLAEIERGTKEGHWMWFIFPQLEGLGLSEMSRCFSLRSLEEARAYLDHPVLGERLRRSVRAVQAMDAASVTEAFGPVDAMKLRSSLTLFIEAGGGADFEEALDTWFSGEPDIETLRLLGS